MKTAVRTAALAAAFVPALMSAQAPVATAFRLNEMEMAKNLVAAAEIMPADKYSFKPTPAQMSFGDIVTHLSQGNDFLCAKISGKVAPTRSKLGPAADKPAMVARLKETFDFCAEALAGLDDSRLGEEMPLFGGKAMSRAAVELLTTGDWADHYSQFAIYLRLNGHLPPTAKKPAM